MKTPPPSPIPLSSTLLSRLSKEFCHHPRYGPADIAISKVIDVLPSNVVYPEVLAKVSIIKTLYATPFYDVAAVANRICSVPGIDDRMIHGDPGLVDAMRQGHGIKPKGSSREMDLYSFSTKYCSFHNPCAFPIYDNLVGRTVAKVLNARKQEPKLAIRDLRKYEVYAEALKTLGRDRSRDSELQGAGSRTLAVLQVL